jgi:hypothetical protein
LPDARSRSVGVRSTKSRTTVFWARCSPTAGVARFTGPRRGRVRPPRRSRHVRYYNIPNLRRRGLPSTQYKYKYKYTVKCFATMVLFFSEHHRSVEARGPYSALWCCVPDTSPIHQRAPAWARLRVTLHVSEYTPHAASGAGNCRPPPRALGMPLDPHSIIA